jgi:type IV pilus assembly protein PilV
MLMKRHLPARGFTLIEVLVTLAIVTVGMLGLAKMQAAAQAETSVARVRSLMNFQAESLASAMRSNPSFWQSQTAAKYPQVTITPKTNGTDYDFTDTNSTLSKASAFACTFTNPCTAPKDLAQDDVNTWATAFAAAFPTGSSATISCSGSATTPEVCDITLTASEHYLAVSPAAIASAAQTGTSSITLHVQP